MPVKSGPALGPPKSHCHSIAHKGLGGPDSLSALTAPRHPWGLAGDQFRASDCEGRTDSPKEGRRILGGPSQDPAVSGRSAAHLLHLKLVYSLGYSSAFCRKIYFYIVKLILHMQFWILFGPDIASCICFHIVSNSLPLSYILLVLPPSGRTDLSP